MILLINHESSEVAVICCEIILYNIVECSIDVTCWSKCVQFLLTSFPLSCGSMLNFQFSIHIYIYIYICINTHYTWPLLAKFQFSKWKSYFRLVQWFYGAFCYHITIYAYIIFWRTTFVAGIPIVKIYASDTIKPSDITIHNISNTLLAQNLKI